MHAEVIGQQVREQIYQDCRLADVAYAECVFEQCQFVDAVLDNLRLVDCVFTNCTVRNVEFRGCAVANVVFRDCDVVGLDWSEVRKYGVGRPLLAEMRGCTLKYNTFVRVKLPRADFSASRIFDCFFQECELREAVFAEADLRNTVFQGCDLRKADFREARSYAINIEDNRIAKAKFSLPEVVGLLGSLDIVIE